MSANPPTTDVSADSPESVAGALDTPLTYDDPALAEIVEAWADLPEALRAGISAMIRASSGSDKEC